MKNSATDFAAIFRVEHSPLQIFPTPCFYDGLYRCWGTSLFKQKRLLNKLRWKGFERKIILKNEWMWALKSFPLANTFILWKHSLPYLIWILWNIIICVYECHERFQCSFVSGKNRLWWSSPILLYGLPVSREMFSVPCVINAGGSRLILFFSIVSIKLSLQVVFLCFNLLLVILSFPQLSLFFYYSTVVIVIVIYCYIEQWTLPSCTASKVIVKLWDSSLRFQGYATYRFTW